MKKTGNYNRILSKMLFEPWCIRPTKHSAMMQILRGHIEGTKIAAQIMPVPDEMDEPEDSVTTQVGAGISIIPISGIIGKKLSMLEMFSGGCDLDYVSEALTTADEDGDIHTIILQMDTPGGLYTGLPETGEMIADIATRKTVIAFTDTECCSAGYWLASQANEIYATKSSTIGSIGMFIAGIDTSVEWEKIGWALELFKGGDLKAMGLDGKAWADNERQFLQAVVDKGYAEFKDVVQKGRGALPEAVMQGQYFDGDQAEAIGLTDGTVRNLQEVIDAALATHYLAIAQI